MTGQYGLYLARNGSEPISPIPITIPTRQMLSFVTLNDIHFVLVGELLLVFSESSITIRKALQHISNGID